MLAAERHQLRPPGKDRKAEETANGKAGAPNPYGRYSGGRETRNEQLIPGA